MSRIAGFLSFGDPRLARQRCGQMAGIFSTAGWSHVCEAIGSAALVWCGSTRPNATKIGEVIAAVDGHFLNLDEFRTLGLRPDAPSAEWLIVLYRAYGFEEALERLAGDYAIGLYDGGTGQLWLARDRVGHRPLYYADTPIGIAFASRPGSLLAIPEVPTEPNRRFVAVFAGSHYRYIDNVPDESPYAAIHQIPAATVLCFTDGVKRTSRYWQLSEHPEFRESEEELAVKYRELLMHAVGARLALCSKPAFTLSGGLDSSSVLSCAVEAAGHKLHAFSSIYTDKTYDESEEIKTFLHHKVAQWHPVSIEGFDLFATVRKMVAAHDEPVATATWLSHFLLCDAVRQAGFDTLFGGLGGDELNAGEYEYFPLHFADLKCRGNEAQLAHEITEWAFHHDHPIYRKNQEVADQLMARLTDSTVPGLVRVEQERLTRYYRAVSRDYFDLAAFIPILDHPFRSYLKNRTHQDIFRETAPCCLRAEDRNCSAFGLAHMDPFFDHRLIEFMFRVPGHMKIRDGITKRLLREAMKGVLPEETRTRIKKTGWNAPAHIWFSGRGVDQVIDLVHSRPFRERGVYNIGEVVKLIEEHRSIVQSGTARENHMMFLWQLLNLEVWFQEVIHRQPVSATTT